jgi:hypothetical protein
MVSIVVPGMPTFANSASFPISRRAGSHSSRMSSEMPSKMQAKFEDSRVSRSKLLKNKDSFTKLMQVAAYLPNIDLKMGANFIISPE